MSVMSDATEAPQTSPTLGFAAQSSLVRITLSPSQTVFHVHGALLCYYSAYFAAACNGRWAEATDGVMLEDVDVQVFNLFIYWLYTQRLPDTAVDVVRLTSSSPTLATGDALPRIDSKRAGYFILLKAAVFGDRILCPAFRAAAHNAFIDNNSTNPVWYDQVKYAFANLPEDSTMLRFMVDMQCACWAPGDDSPEEEVARGQLPVAFLVRVMVRFAGAKGNPIERRDVELAEYHVHDEGAEEQQEEDEGKRRRRRDSKDVMGE